MDVCRVAGRAVYASCRRLDSSQFFSETNCDCDTTMSLSDEQAAFLLDVCKLVPYATSLGFKVTGGELQRTQAQQEIYVKTGKSKTLNSNHLKKLAIDLNFIRDGQLIYDKHDLAPIGAYWESLNSKNRWGGNFKSILDMPHFERHVP